MTKIIACMATYPGRKIDATLQSIESLIDQVDELHLCLNQFTEIPPSYASRVSAFLPDQDLKDVGKFASKKPNASDRVFLVDDDIIYPPDYVVNLIDCLDRYKEYCPVVGVHGIIYPDFFDGSPSARKVFSFTQALDGPRVVNQLGTGTVCLLGEYMPGLDYMLGSQRYVDLRFAAWQYSMNRPLVCVPRVKGWMREIQSDETIFETFTKNWSDDVVSEAQAIAGYSKLNLEAVSGIELS